MACASALLGLGAPLVALGLAALQVGLPVALAVDGEVVERLPGVDAGVVAVEGE